MKRVHLLSYIKGKYIKERNLNTSTLEIKSEEQLNDYLEFSKKAIDELLNNLETPTVDDLNNMVQDLSNSYEKKMKGKEPAFDEDMANYKKPVISKMSPEELEHRKQVNQKAIKIMTDIIVDMETSEKKAKMNTVQKETIHRQTINVGKAIFGADYIKAVQEKDYPNKKQMFMDYVRNMKNDIQKFATKMSDEEFLEEYPKAAKYFNNINELQNDSLLEISKHLNLELSEQEKAEIDEFRDKYSVWGVSMASNIENRLACLSDPMYATVREEDMIRFMAYADKFGEYLDDSIINTATTKYLKSKSYGSDNELSGFNSYYAVNQAFFNDTLVEEITSVNTNHQVNKNIKDSLDFFFNINKDEKYEIYNSSVNKEEQLKDYSIDDMADALNKGNELLLTDKAGKTFSLVSDKITGELIKNDNPKVLNGIELNGKTAAINMQDVKKQAEPFIKGLGKVNSIFFKNTTPAFNEMTKTLKDLKKLDPEKDKDKYLEGLQNAAKYAKEYLKAKNVDGKVRTSNTEARLQFARDIVKNFENCKNLQEFRELNVTKDLTKESTGRVKASEDLVNKLNKTVNDSKKVEKEEVVKEVVNQVEKTEQLENSKQ